ncbi:MAG: A/G-specific adenine glycosylase [Verrucomicrobia bacterium]|nr:A/G-specific adenine glycosylase [Verrucomicrobiota bacterium]
MATHASRITHHLPRTKLVARLLTWFAASARDLPWRRTRDPYAIWVSEIMLQQTQVKTVMPYWEHWMRELPTIQAAAKASPAKLHKLWEGLGYYTRVRNLQKAAQQVITQQGGKFPKHFDEILALPGIGRYTAGAIASIAFNQPRPILDGNVIRVLTRVFGIATDPREKQTNARLWQLAEELVLHASCITHHASPCSHLNQSLMELGALICTPRAPQCGFCPINKLCLAHKQGLQEQLPNLAKPIKPTSRGFIAFVVQRNGKFLVRQRTAGVVNAHLWEFPNVEVGARVCDPQHAAENELGVHLSGVKPLHTIKHSITRYRITLQAYRAKLGRTRHTSPKLEGQWLTCRQLAKLAFTSAHKKILNQLRAPSAASAQRNK